MISRENLLKNKSRHESAEKIIEEHIASRYTNRCFFFFTNPFSRISQIIFDRSYTRPFSPVISVPLPQRTGLPRDLIVVIN